MSRTWTPCALAMALSVAAGSGLSAIGPKELLEDSCAAKATRRIPIPIPGRFPKPPFIGDLASNPPIQQSPICAIQNAAEVLVLTGILMDQAALSAARGLNAALAALGRQQMFAGQIADLERATKGLGTGNPEATAMLITEVSDTSGNVSEDLEALRRERALDPVVISNLAEAQASLHEVRHYATAAGVGVTRFTMLQAESRQSPTATLTQIGFTPEFAERLPRRAGSLPGTLKNTFRLRSTIADIVGDKRDDKEADDAERRVREAVQEQASSVGQGMRSAATSGRTR